MPFQPGQSGNPGGKTQNKPWADAIRMAIAQDDPERLRKLAKRLLDKAEEGDMAALKELGDRLDGKPAQVVQGDAEQPLNMNLNVKFGSGGS